MNGMSEAARLGELSAPRRNNYFYGKLMDVPHFQMEQNYEIRHRWLLNRLSLGQGVLCGLGVTPSSDGTHICVAPGVAIDALGREIVVPVTACLDPWQLTTECGQPGTPLDKTQNQQVYICLSYRECTTDFMPVLVTDCNTREQCSPGTIVETFCLSVLKVVPPPPPPPQEPPALPDPNPQACQALQNGKDAANRRLLLCMALSGDCAPSGDPCISLATINLKAGGTTISTTDIDTCTYRPRIYSNAVLLDLILCLAARIEQCCSGAHPCKGGFPVGYVPFDRVESTVGPDPSTGDSVIVGSMTAASWAQFIAVIALPDVANQFYCDTFQPARESPNLRVLAYVPSAAERNGDFSQFRLPLPDPNHPGSNFPNNQIPLPPSGTGGVFAWRIRSIVP